MQVPNRFESIEDYRYGFQGQEKDDEIKGEGNSLNYTFRMHDPRVGRFFAIDPLFAEYPHYTPYSFSGNKVILFTELEGLEEKIPEIQNTIYAKSFYNPKLDMDMSNVGANATSINGNYSTASTYTLKGGVRNYIAYWNKQLEVNPEMFDPSNVAKIKNGSAPIVNDQWIKHNPTHAEFKGDVLEHHHKYQGKVATAIPSKIHDKLSKYYHPFKRINPKTLKTLGGVRGFAGKVGNILNVFGTVVDVFTDNPNSSYNQTFGNGSNVGQLYQQLNEDGTAVTNSYYIINSRETKYNSSGDPIQVTASVTSYNLIYNEKNDKNEMIPGETATFVQGKNDKEARKITIN
jgi:RHS repeat-associated protein